MNNTPKLPVQEGIGVIDFGSQYTLLIARRLRELGYFSEVIPATTSQPPHNMTLRGIILSGGPQSVLQGDAPSIPEWVWQLECPILGICYGMQALAHHFGSRLSVSEQREYGAEEVIIKKCEHPLWSFLNNQPRSIKVWMSHGDHVKELTDDWDVLAYSTNNVIAAISHKTKPIVGLQFHPEVEHTQEGRPILQAFIKHLCRLSPNWSPTDILSHLKAQIRQQVGNGRVLMAVSGGVDSTVAAVLLKEALGHEQVTTVFVDHGLLRKNEARWVKEQFAQLGLSQFYLLDKKDLFLSRLHNISDPEQKRKIIGQTFIEVFEAFAHEHEHEFTHLGQGTLYPDVIESAGHGSGSQVIKSHHNVGGLPEVLALKLVEPFRYLFKDEVRRLGAELKIPHELLWRHPFPGPGLAVRILGCIDSNKVTILQEADNIFIEELRKAQLYDKAWQAFVVLLPVQSVGVMGDQRSYEYVCALRAVTATDGMTADVCHLPLHFLKATADKIIRQVKGINRVVYDVTSKPPGTIEWE